MNGSTNFSKVCCNRPTPLLSPCVALSLTRFCSPMLKVLSPLQCLPLEISYEIVARLSFEDLRSATRCCRLFRLAVHSRVLAAVIRALRVWWPTQAERLLIHMEGCGAGITGTAAAQVMMDLGVDGAEVVYQSCLRERCTFLIANDAVSLVSSAFEEPPVTKKRFLQAIRAIYPNLGVLARAIADGGSFMVCARNDPR